MKKTSKTRIFLYVSTIFFLLFVFINIFFINYIRVESNNVSLLTRVFNEEYSQNRTTSNISSRLSEVSTKDELISNLFLPEDEMVNFVSEIEKLGQDRNLIIETKDLDASGLYNKDTGRKKEYGKLQISINSKGVFSDIEPFIKILENIPYHSFISSLELSKDNGESDFWSLSAMINVTIETK